jgi:hypothetical protein
VEIQASEPKQEHIKAVTWLNERLNKSGFSFYLVKVEAFKIGESEPAPLFSAIVGPSEEAIKIGEEKEEDVERFIKRKQFWSQLLKKCEGRLPLYSNVSPSKDHWLSAGSGRGGIHYNFIVMAKDGGRLELVISRGKDSQEENKRIFDELYSKREKIEKELGEEIIWERLDNKVSSRLEVRYPFGGLYEEDKWDKLQETMINGMIKFEKTLGPYLKALKL